MRKGALVIGLLALMGVSPLGAQDPRDTLVPDPIRIALQVGGAVHENFFQAPHGLPDTTVRAATARIRFSEGWFDAMNGEGYLDGRATLYDGFEPTYGTGGGVRVDRWGQRLDVGVDYDWWLPRLEGPDAVGRADVGTVRGDYWVRLGRLLELSGTGRLRRERFIESAPVGAGEGEIGPLPGPGHRDQAFADWGGAVRLRALGSVFSPEVGTGRGGPRGVAPGQAYDQRQSHVQIRSMPHPRVYLGARYRLRERSYPRAPEGSGNFEREDRRAQVTLLTEVRFTPTIAAVAYYSREDARSSREHRDFTTRFLSLGLTLRRDLPVP
jgi:hypothetical protein